MPSLHTPAAWAASLTLLMSVSVPAEAIDHKTAAEYFAEAKAASDADAGKLWGIPLYGPMLFVDPQTRALVANQADAEGKLVKQGEVWTGVLPPDQTMANTAKVWAGVEWTMILWPALGGDKISRSRLMMHELYHRIQDDLRLPAANPTNAHLDTRDGRVWMQLEWRALAVALKKESEERKAAIADALLFRQQRRALFSTAAPEESALEINEGLAEYTGVRLSGQTDTKQRSHAARQCESHAQTHPSLTRSFAYTSGPAYGLLLDSLKPDWRSSLKANSDLGAMLMAAIGTSIPTDLGGAAQDRAIVYDGKKLMADEDQREITRRKKLAEYQTKFVDGPTLTIPLEGNVNYSYDPNTIEAVDGLGLVYPTLTVTDAWGVLEVSNGAVMVRENEQPIRVIVAMPANANRHTRESKDWKLKLNSGWELRPATRNGDFEAVKNE